MEHVKDNRIDDIFNPIKKVWDPFGEYKKSDDCLCANDDSFLPCSPYLFPYEVTQYDKVEYADDLQLEKIMQLAIRSVQLTRSICAKSYFSNSSQKEVLDLRTGKYVKYTGSNGACLNSSGNKDTFDSAPKNVPEIRNGYYL